MQSVLADRGMRPVPGVGDLYLRHFPHGPAPVSGGIRVDWVRLGLYQTTVKERFGCEL